MSEDDKVELKIGDLNQRTLSRESLNLMIDCWLPLIILVFSFTKVYITLAEGICLWMTQHLNIFDLNVCLHTFDDLSVGWHAFNTLSLFKSTNSLLIFAAGAVLFKFLLHLERRNTGTLEAPESFLMCLSLGDFVSGLWLHYARTLPLVKTPSFYNFDTLFYHAVTSYAKMRLGFSTLGLFLD